MPMKIGTAPLALAVGFFSAVPAQAQQDGIYIVDFSEADEERSTAVAAMLVSAAEEVADPAVILCSTSDGDRGHYHREQMRARLVDAGAMPQRIMDAGLCTTLITGRFNDDIGDGRVWVALSTVPYLEQWRRQTFGY
ncbi:hypothetical protein [Aurantiacibacter sediminis]|uniref:Uncharacterized protein n=1 Tax=Aurantiacibacter sediminis TaxID=2793064 RepID=A0ABS0MZC9_9SPHN|nr:hypothetical protein [Aurantiacibacter sediminis]MBH5321064.1 hypothetical protein [Aurantiacibacter sediminis]